MGKRRKKKQTGPRDLGLAEHRPGGSGGRCDPHLPEICRTLNRELISVFRKLDYSTLRLQPGQRRELAVILVEFAEDIHCDIGIWRTVERFNEEKFGVRLPFLAGREVAIPDEISAPRIQHLLWGVYSAFNPDLILSPTHPDLARLAEKTSCFLKDRFASVPTDSGVAGFLETPNTYGWDVRRKLLWLGRHGYLFRNLFQNHARMQGDEESFVVTDDFICRETTIWSGLGVIDVLAGTLEISPGQRKELRAWYERHLAYYRVTSIQGPVIETLNLINDKPYGVRIGEDHVHKYPIRSIFLGSLVPWQDDWYLSGSHWGLGAVPEDKLDELKRSFLKRSPGVAYRYCKELADKAVKNSQRRFEHFVERHGTDLTVFRNGLDMAADLQRAGRELFETATPETTARVMAEHGLAKPWPNLSIPDELLECEEEVGVFYQPDLGWEILPGFGDIVTALKKRGADLTEDEKAAVYGIIKDQVISPEFIHRLLRESGAESILKTFLLRSSAPYALELLLRRHKGSHFRKRYARIGFV